MNALTCTRDVEAVAMVQVSHTMPTRGVSRIHEATPSGLLIIASCIRDTPRVDMV